MLSESGAGQGMLQGGLPRLGYGVSLSGGTQIGIGQQSKMEVLGCCGHLGGDG